MKVVVLQSFVGKGYVDNWNLDSKNSTFEVNQTQQLLFKCMKSVKNWCKKKGYEYILNRKDLKWDYFNSGFKKIGFIYTDDDREKDLSSQIHEICLKINDADYIILLHNDIWVYRDFELPKIKNIGLCINLNTIMKGFRSRSPGHTEYIRKIIHGNIHYPQTGVQFINGTANKHYNEWIVNSIKSDNWPIFWSKLNQPFVYEYSRQYPEKITWLDSRYNSIPGKYTMKNASCPIEDKETDNQMRNSYLIHFAGTHKYVGLDKLPDDMKKEFNNIK